MTYNIKTGKEKILFVIIIVGMTRKSSHAKI